MATRRNEEKKQTLSDAVTDHERSREVLIDYTNYKGVRRWRRIIPLEKSIYFGTTFDHHEPQWLLPAHDVEKGGLRTFALRTIHRTVTGNYKIHNVVPGDTLSGIEERYGVPYTLIATLNKIEDPDLIFPGWSLLIPYPEK